MIVSQLNNLRLKPRIMKITSPPKGMNISYLTDYFFWKQSESNPKIF